VGETHHRAPPVPIILATGYLGAGKTTAVNHLLTNAEGRRIAAIVNDFGAINIDAELIAGTNDGVISLANGCICCSLEGDLLRTLSTLLRRDPRPDYIVIETSGIADPYDIVRNLMDPIIWREAPLETVLCLADATTLAFEDAIFQSTIRAADIVAITKTDLADPTRLKAAIARLKPAAIIVDAPHRQIPPDLLFPPDPNHLPRPTPKRHQVADRFETLSWTTDAPLSLPRLQSAIGRLSPKLARAKGLFETTDSPGQQTLLQLAAGRATLSPAAPRSEGAPRTRLVFIAELGTLTQADLDAALTPCIA
jgi:G3E family GTPase